MPEAYIPKGPPPINPPPHQPDPPPHQPGSTEPKSTRKFFEEHDLSKAVAEEGDDDEDE